MECPQCKKEITMKIMFNHIRGKHPGYFQQLTTKKWLEDASSGKPLRIMWEVKDDFDELEIISVYGCLSSNKTFKTEYKALEHFKKNKNDLKEHNKQIKELMKTRVRVLTLDAEKAKAQTQGPPLPLALQEYKMLMETNDPELIDTLKSICDNYFIICEKLCEDAKSLDPNLENTALYFYKAVETMKIIDVIKLFDNIQKCRESAKTFKDYCKILKHLERVLMIRYEFKDELDYPWFPSIYHPYGLLDRGNSRFLKFLFPWNEIVPLMQ